MITTSLQDIMDEVKSEVTETKIEPSIESQDTKVKEKVEDKPSLTADNGLKTNAGEQPKVESPEKTDPIKVDLKPKYSKEEKENYAFAKLKERKNREIERLKKDIEDLKKSQKKEGLKKEGFTSEEDYQKYLVEQGVSSFLIKDKESQLNAAKYDEEIENTNEEASRKIANCFPDEEEREIYFKNYDEASIEKEWKIANGQLLKASILDIISQKGLKQPDYTVLNHIVGSELGPKVLNYLITNLPELGKIMNMRDPLDKKLALRDIEKTFSNGKSVITHNSDVTNGNRLSFTRTKSNKIETQPSPVLKTVPKIGSQVKNSVNNSIGDFGSDDDVFSFIRNHR